MGFSTLQNQKENKSRYWMKRGNSDIKMHIKAPTRCYQHVTHFIALHFLHAFTHSIWTMSEEQFIRGFWVDSKLWGLLRISISISVLRTYFFSKWKYKRIPWFSTASMKNLRLCILNIEIWIHFAISSQHAIPKSAIYPSFFLPLVCIYLPFCLQLSIASWIKYTLLMALVGKICLLGVTNILFHCRLHSLNTANESVVLVLNVLARMQTSNC